MAQAKSRICVYCLDIHLWWGPEPEHLGAKGSKLKVTSVPGTRHSPDKVTCCGGDPEEETGSQNAKC